MTRRWLATFALLIGLSCPAFSQVPKDPIAAAAPPPAAEEAEEGDPLYGYLAFTFLTGIALFAVCKSARRS